MVCFVLGIYIQNHKIYWSDEERNFNGIPFIILGTRALDTVSSSLKELRNRNESSFCAHHKNRRKHNHISKLLFFTIHLHFVISNQISTYRKLNLPLTSIIYFVFLPLEMQERLKQTKVCDAFAYFSWKGTTHKPLKVAAAKSIFSKSCKACMYQ